MKVGRARFVCLALILIQNLHASRAIFGLGDLASKVTDAASNIYQRNVAGESQNQRNGNADNGQVTPIDIAKENNYPIEAHDVTTEDGYILTIYRIPGSTGSPAVFLQHGLLESAGDWLVAGRGRSLAFILADNGYDVWLGNARGNTYSKKHVTLSTSDPKFWDFSWTELGLYDLPAVVTYISELKGDSIFYIGHSMGATSFSVMSIERPEIARNIKAMIGLAPATYVYHLKSPMKLIAPFWKEFQRVANLLGIYEFLPRSGFFDAFAKYICKSFLLKNAVCSNTLFLIGGYSPEQLDRSLVPTIWKNFPAGTSVKLYTHWLQQINVDKFRKFDYGLETNLKVYNSSSPPNYDLSKVEAPVSVFWAKNDVLVGPEDTYRFYNEVPNKAGIFKVEVDKFNHFDFLWGYDAPKLVYPKVLEILSTHNNEISRN